MKTYNKLGGIIIPIVKTDPCFRLTQYGKGMDITCKCIVCKGKNQTPEEAKKNMDKIYKGL